MTDAPAPATHESTEAPKEASGGMPQFDFATWPGQIFWLVIIFVALYALLSSVFLPRVKAALAARAARIDGDMAEARRLRNEAEAQAEAARRELTEARAKAQRTGADAKAKASAEAAARQTDVESQLNAKLEAAEDRIQADREQAMTHVRAIAAETAAAMVEKLTGQAGSSAELEAAIVSAAGRTN